MAALTSRSNALSGNVIAGEVNAPQLGQAEQGCNWKGALHGLVWH